MRTFLTAALAGLSLLAVSLPNAYAYDHDGDHGWHGRGHEWHEHEWREREWHGPRYIRQWHYDHWVYVPTPVYYAPPPVPYYPQPVYYAPPAYGISSFHFFIR